MAIPSSMNVHSPLISAAYEELLLGKKRAIPIQQGIVGFAQLTMLRNRLPINLETMEVADVPPTNDEINDPTWDDFEWNDWDTFLFDEDVITDSSSSASAALDVTLKARFREASLGDTTVWQSDVIVFDATRGIIRTPIPAAIRTATGIYLMEVGLFNADDELIFTNECYIYNIHSAWGTQGIKGPPSIDDVRLSLSDGDPIMNELLDEYAFDLAEIAFAATRVVTYWRNQPPQIGGTHYSTKNFPWREIWLQGIQIFLWQLATEHYRRNHLKYSAGGVTIADKDRTREYATAWQTKFGEWKDLLMHKKAELNMRRGYGSFGSGYPH